MLPSGNNSHPPFQDLAAFVRDRRRANGISQSQLGLLAGVGRRFVSELENAKPTLQLDKVDRVLRVFGRRLGLVELERDANVHDTPGTSVWR